MQNSAEPAQPGRYKVQAIPHKHYMAELHDLQVEFVKLQRHFIVGGDRILVLREWRDACGPYGMKNSPGKGPTKATAQMQAGTRTANRRISRSRLAEALYQNSRVDLRLLACGPNSVALGYVLVHFHQKGIV